MKVGKFIFLFPGSFLAIFSIGGGNSDIFDVPAEG